MCKTVTIPDWYWTNGLHDAIIERVAFHSLPYDYTLKNPIRNELVICIDASQSMFEQSIRQICFYNCKIENTIDLDSLSGAWWINDVLSYDNKWRLTINLGSKKEKVCTLSISFDSVKNVSAE